MKKTLLFLLLIPFLWSAPCTAQIKKAAEDILALTTKESQLPKADEATLAGYADSIKRADSLKISDLTLQLQQMQLNKIMLTEQLNKNKEGQLTDSLREQQRRQSIDSLRHHTKGVPLVIGSDTLLTIYANIGGISPSERVAKAKEQIERTGKIRGVVPDSIYLFEVDNLAEIMYQQKVLFSVTNNDALWMNTSRKALSQEYLTVIRTEVARLKEQHSLFQLAKRIAYFLLVILCQMLFFKGMAYLYRRMRERINRLAITKMKPITIRDYEFLDTNRQARILTFATNIIRYIINLLSLIITVPILFAIFPQTEELARKIFSYILIPIKSILFGMVEYIPNLFTIAIIFFTIRYVIKGLRYIANEIEHEKLKLTGFYADWAQPSFNILRFLLYAFMIAMIYPYLPGSDTGVFQGISVFVGLIVSLGSTAVIGNIIAGLVITYMRAFKVGDRIKLGETTGNVIEKTPFVTRIRTPKNEVVTIPNSFILSSQTTNYSASARNFGLIIHSSVTIGYDAPWREVHRLLIEAAKATEGVISAPEPFVLETELSDFYPVYQINAYIEDANRLAQIYSDLHQNIQDKFNEAGVEIMSPHYRAERDGNASTIPLQYKK